jgi:hypothetical protein
MRRFLPILTGGVLLVLTGVVHGLWTGRWHTSEALVAAAARVEAVPRTIGTWQGKELPTDPALYAQAGARGYWLRAYATDRGGAVSVVLMCGPWSKMSVHTPDFCYSGAGYEMVGAAVREKVTAPGAAPAEFWTARFRKQSPTGATFLRILWSWSTDGTWRAPDRPRWTFAGSPYLYKLYLVRDVTGEVEPAELVRSLAFLPELLPELQKSLFAPAALPREKL